MNPYEIIRRPHVTEKAMYQQTKLNAFTFEVDPRANRIQVKQALEKLFNVNVVKVTIRNRSGKERRRRASVGYTSDRKLALVTLAEGQRIEGM